MALIPGSVPVTGLIAPTDTTDTFAVTDPVYGIDGLRSVLNLAARNSISTERRREGMIVYIQYDHSYWRLIPPPWDGSDFDWVQILQNNGVGTQGPQGAIGPQGLNGAVGAQGPQGNQGSSLTTFTFVQSQPATTWIVSHNLARYPSVTVVDSAGNQFIGDVVYIDGNNIQIVFSAGFSGNAYLN